MKKRKLEASSSATSADSDQNTSAHKKRRKSSRTPRSLRDESHSPQNSSDRRSAHSSVSLNTEEVRLPTAAQMTLLLLGGIGCILARPRLKTADTSPISMDDARRLVVEKLGADYVARASAVTGKRRWSEEELELLKVLHSRKLTNGEVAGLLVRSKYSIDGQLIRLRHPERYRKDPSRVKHRVDPPWVTRVVIALSKLPGQEGNSAEVFKVIGETWHDMDSEKSSGHNHPKWYKAAMWGLSKSPIVEKIPISKGKVRSRYRYKLKAVDARGVLEEYERLKRDDIAQRSRAKRLKSKNSLSYVKAFRK